MEARNITERAKDGLVDPQRRPKRVHRRPTHSAGHGEKRRKSRNESHKKNNGVSLEGAQPSHEKYIF
jgi:hypothetical protein